MTEKKIIIIAGSSGAGKTIFAVEFLPHDASCPNFVNANWIAAGLVPFTSEETIQRVFRLTWFVTSFDVNSEVNNGRGPADYKISYGERDSTIVEFKLAVSSSLKRNLLNQTEIYKKASKSINDIKVILCYTQSEIAKVNRILKSIKQEGTENIVIIDASIKTSASKV